MMNTDCWGLQTWKGWESRLEPHNPSVPWRFPVTFPVQSSVGRMRSSSQGNTQQSPCWNRRPDGCVKYGFTSSAVLIRTFTGSLLAGTEAPWRWSSPPRSPAGTRTWASPQALSSSRSASGRAGIRGTLPDRASCSPAPPGPTPPGSPSLWEQDRNQAQSQIISSFVFFRGRGTGYTNDPLK